MGLIIPVDKLTPEQYQSVIDQLTSQGFSLAESLIKATKKVDRMLKPSDLGLTGNEWTFDISSTSMTIINTTLPDDALVIIFGIYNLSDTPVTTEVKFGDNTTIIDDIFLEDMYLYDHPMVILKSPIIYQPKSTVKIDVLAKGTNSAEKLGFLGIVIERAGKNISG